MAAIGFGRGNPFPFKLGSGISYVETENQAMLTSLRKGYKPDDETAHAAEVYAHALVLASIWATNNRLRNQALPLKMLEALPMWEEICSLRPANNARDIDRRSAVAAKLRGAAGNTLGDITEALAELLGTAFVAIDVVDPTDEVVYWPAEYPGPPGFEWSSNRAHLYIQVQKGTRTDVEFYSLIASMDAFLRSYLPAWCTYNWNTGSGFIVGESLIGEMGL